MLPISKESAKSHYAPITQRIARILCRLSSACWTVYVELRQKAPAGYPVRVKADAIATQYEIGLRTVRRALKELEAVGLLSPETNGYRIVRDPERMRPFLAPQSAKNGTVRVPKMAAESAKNGTEKDSDNQSEIKTETAIQPTARVENKEHIAEKIYREPQEAIAGETATSDVVLFKDADQEKRREIIKRLLSTGVSDMVAYQLAKSYPLDRIEQQLEWLPNRPAENKPGLLVKAIKENFSAPAAIAKASEQKAEDERQTARKRDRVLSEVKLRFAERQKPVMQRAAATVYGIVEMAKTLRKPVPSDDEISAKIENAAVVIASRDIQEEEQDRRALALVGISYDELVRKIF